MSRMRARENERRLQRAHSRYRVDPAPSTRFEGWRLTVTYGMQGWLRTPCQLSSQVI